MTYRDHALAILAAGYSPIPLAPATKDGNIPQGFSGYDGVMASRADVETWREDRPDDNVGARLPKEGIGLDVDAYNGKSGGTTFAGKVQEYGDLPLTWRVSSRFGGDYDGVSGIRLYRLPEEYVARASDPDAGWIGGWAHVDLIRFGHRFVVAPGSIHDTRRTPYLVLDETTGEITDRLPDVVDLPLLPASWCAALLHGDEGRERRDKAESQWWTDGKPCAAVLKRLGQALAELETGRHDTVMPNMLALTRLGEQGHAGVREAIDQLRGAFTMMATAEGPGKRSHEKARKEWIALVGPLDAKIEAGGLTDDADRGCCGTEDLAEWLGGGNLKEVAGPEVIPEVSPAPRLTLVSFADITERTIEWLVPDLIPKAEVVIGLGEEGIGKGLWWAWLLGRVTTGPDAIDVVVIVAEDSADATVLPRLKAAGADTSRVHLLTLDPETYTGVPTIPGNSIEVAELVESVGASLVIVDPWLSVVPGKLQVKDTQQARQALDPVTRLARRTGAAFLLITHTNRTASTRARDLYGATVALRQAGRVCVMALQDPNEDDVVYVGIEKSNIMGPAPATRFRKTGNVGTASWRLLDTGEHVGLTIRDLVDLFAQAEDGRSTDKWTEVAVKAAQAGGLITRADVIAIYADAAEPAKAADKAIARWRNTDPPRLTAVSGQRGVFDVAGAGGSVTSKPPMNPPLPHYPDMGGMGGSDGETPRTPRKTNGGSWGVAGGNEETAPELDRPVADADHDPWTSIEEPFDLGDLAEVAP